MPMKTNYVLILDDGSKVVVSTTASDKYTVDHGGMTETVPTIAVALAKAFELALPPVDRRAFLGSFLALRDECVNLRDKLEASRQIELAVASRCAALQLERDRFFTMKAETAGRYAEERALRMKLEGELAELQAK